MTVETKVEPIDRDLILSLIGTPKERSAIFAEFAREQLADAEQINESVLGHIPTHTAFVDGSEGASEDDVRPDGVIIYEFALVTDLFTWIRDQLQQHSPIGSGADPHPGLYQRSNLFYAGGVEADPADPPLGATEYAFVNVQPYAAKIERGLSRQFPDGVYQTVATMARDRFGDQARIEFNYRALVGSSITSVPPRKNTRAALAANKSDVRQPSIIITVK